MSTPALSVPEADAGTSPEIENVSSEFDFFSALGPMRPKKKRKRERKRKITISISGVESKPAKLEGKNSSAKKESSFVVVDETTPQCGPWDNDAEFSGNDWLDFYSETHEDQDPGFLEHQHRRHEEELKKRLADVDKKDMTVRAEIDKVVTELLKEKQTAMERGIEAYRERIRQEEKKLVARLNERYQERKASNEQKISQRVDQLRQEQQKQLSMALTQHRQQSQHRRLPDSVASQEWQMTSQQFQAKHQQQHQELKQRTDEYKRRTELEYKQEQEKIRKLQEQKLSDVDTKRTSILSELIKQFTASRQRYLKRHLQRIMKEKEDLKNQVDEQNNKVTGESTDHKHEEGKVKSVRDLAKSAVEHKQELRPPSPFKSVPAWVDPDQESTIGASTRYKHRKGVLSSAQIQSQLSVEIHNEGIWVLKIVKDQSGKMKVPSQTSSTAATAAGSSSGLPDDSGHGSSHSDNAVDPEFVPWGIRAYEFLENVVNGEIPLSCLGAGRRLQFSDNPVITQTSGQIFCSITDLRTSEETAQQQRAASLREYEASTLAELEKKAAELTKLATEHEKASAKLEKEEKQFSVTLDTAAKDQEKARKLKEEFNRRYKQYLQADGTPLPSVSSKDRLDIQNKIMRFDANIRNSDDKFNLARQKHADVKNKLEALQTAVLQAQQSATVVTNMIKKRKALATAAANTTEGNKAKHLCDAGEGERTVTRVKDIIGSLEKVAEKRRDQHNQKKSQPITCTWLQSHPTLPISLKKSLWRRMHRRKLQVVLRPSMDYLCQEVRSKAASMLESSPNDKNTDSERIKMEEAILKAEQKLLLACHPVADPSALSVPSSKSTEAWAEPGWRLDLSVPAGTQDDSIILPCAPSFPVLEKSLSEVCSIPGRQAASFLSTLHLRFLGLPLSTFGIISSPAEIPSVLEQEADHKDVSGDPFNITEAEIKAGYALNIKTAPPKSAAHSRRKSKDENDKTTLAKTPAKTTASTKANPRGTAKSNTASKAPASSAKPSTVSKATPQNDKPSHSPNEKPDKKRRGESKTDAPPRKRKKQDTSNPPKATELSSATAHQTGRKPAATQAQSRTKPSQIQTQHPLNAGQQSAYPSPHQRQQQLAQLRMMQQARQGQVPPGPPYQPPPASMQQMQQLQQFYAPLNHPTGPSPRGGQYHPALSPNVPRMQGGPIPMHPGMAMQNAGQQNLSMGGRQMGGPGQTNHPIAGMAPPPGSQQPRSRGAPMNAAAGNPSQQHQHQHQQPNQQQQPNAKAPAPGNSNKDQNDPLYMLK